MKLKANDTLHVSSVKAENIKPGEEFEVSDDFGRQMVERGLATEVTKPQPKAEAPIEPEAREPEPVKAEAPPLNKMTAPPSNKSKQHKKGR